MNAVVTQSEPAKTRDGKRSVSVLSRASVEIPLSDVMTDGRLDIFPYVEDKGLLFLQFRKSKVILSAGPFVGLIPLTPTLTVDVQPKMPIGNFARVVAVAQQALLSLPASTRSYLTRDLPGNGVLEFLAWNLLDAIRPIDQHGLLKRYVRTIERTSSPRGRINLTGTMTSMWSTGQRHKVQAELFEQTSNVGLNRVVKSALTSLLVRVGAIRDHTLISKLNRAYFDFPSVVDQASARDFEEVRNVLSARSLPEGRDYYYRAIQIALLIVLDKGISLQEYGSEVELSSFIVNFEVMFEEYLRSVLRMHASGRGIDILDGNGVGKKSLFDDRSEPPAQPDIVVSSLVTGKRVIAEVKYKKKPIREDYNQAITYGLCYRTSQVILVHQSGTPGSGGLTRVGVIGAIAVDAYEFDLSNPDLENEELRFAEAIFASVA